jgi:hypothetical protein
MPESKTSAHPDGTSLATWLDLWNLALILAGVTAVLLLIPR